MASMESPASSLSLAGGSASFSLLAGLRRTGTNESTGSRGKIMDRLSGGGRDKPSPHNVVAAMSHLASFVDQDTMPFLASCPLPNAVMVEPHEIKEGKLLGEGDFSKTYEVKGFKFSKSMANPLVRVSTNSDYADDKGDDSVNTGSNHHDNCYAIKHLYVKPPPEGQGGGAVSSQTFNHNVAYFDMAAKKLVKECLYLSNLNHPFILSFRGFFLKDKAAFASQQLDAFHLVTDRIGETLEQRMKTWKQARQKLAKENTTEQFILESVQLDLAISFNTKLNMHKPDTNRKMKKLKKKGAEVAQQNSRHGATGSTSPYNIKPEQYPQDLVPLQTVYVLQILHALEYLHERGIVVRDLRPNTIGFKEFPNHHTIQLFSLGFCQEESINGELLPPEFIRASVSGGLSLSHHQPCMGALMDDDSTHACPTTTMLDSSCHSHHSTAGSNSASSAGRASFRRKRSNNSVSHHLRRKLSREVNKPTPRTEGKFYRAPESYPLVDPGSGNSHSDIRNPRETRATSSKQSTSPPEEAKTTTDLSNGKGEAVVGNPNHTEPNHRYLGYNCKADIYSLSMIYFEMLAEGKPYSKSTIQRESHFHRVQSQGLRPNLAKYHWPRTLKCILTQAWHPKLEKRLSATQFRQRLTAVLQLLEWKGGAIVLRGTMTDNSSSSTAGSSYGTSPTSTGSEDQLDATNLHSLPSRAEALLVGACRQRAANPGRELVSWSMLWNTTPTGQKKLDSRQVMEAIEERRVVKSKNTNNSKSKRKKRAAAERPTKSFRDYLPSLNGGMNEENTAQGRRLLGKSFERR